MKNIISIAAGTIASHKAISGELDVTAFSAFADLALGTIVTGGTATDITAAELQTCDVSGGTFAKVADLTVGQDLHFDTRDCQKYIRVVVTCDNATTGVTIAVAVAGGVEEL